MARPPRWHRPVVILLGVVCGGAAGMDVLAGREDGGSVGDGRIAAHLVAGAAGLALLLLALSAVTVRLINRLDIGPQGRARFLRYDAVSYLPSLVTLLGAVGVQLIGPVIAMAALALVLLKSLLLYLAVTAEERRRAFSSLGYLAFLFLISGFAALIYQIVWQRALFAAFGVNIESITIIVSLFMFGLGIGSMVGGLLSWRFPERAPALFLTCELGIGLFGVASLPLIRLVSGLTLRGPVWSVGLSVFGLLCLPTMLMGATLPILVGHLHRHYRNVGKSVGILYCINTLGSAVACFITADLLFALVGQQGSVLAAALCNMTVALLVSGYARRIAADKQG